MNFHISTQDIATAEFLDSKYPRETTGDRLYTDGSKLEDGNTASADYRESDGTSDGLKLNKVTSVYNAELIAIANALQRMYEDPQSQNDAVVLSDSQSALQSLQNVKQGDNPPFIAQNIIRVVNDLKRDRGALIQLQWIPGHSHIHGNTVADITAKNGRHTDWYTAQ
uniref:RNase H type-1 domain-containing protein n=1 Tax=Lygus hesperus TaxID=30085 RepID=A0A146M1G1_LYGHE